MSIAKSKQVGFIVGLLYTINVSAAPVGPANTETFESKLVEEKFPSGIILKSRIDLVSEPVNHPRRLSIYLSCKDSTKSSPLLLDSPVCDLGGIQVDAQTAEVIIKLKNYDQNKGTCTRESSKVISYKTYCPK